MKRSLDASATSDDLEELSPFSSTPVQSLSVKSGLCGYLVESQSILRFPRAFLWCPYGRQKNSVSGCACLPYEVHHLAYPDKPNRFGVKVFLHYQRSTESKINTELYS